MGQKISVIFEHITYINVKKIYIDNKNIIHRIYIRNIFKINRPITPSDHNTHQTVSQILLAQIDNFVYLLMMQ